MNTKNETRYLDQLTVLLDWKIWALPLVLAIVLIITSYYNYILFHTLAELFAIVVGIMMYVVALQTHKYSHEHFLMFLASGYFWIAILDLFHMLVYKGMSIYPVDIANYSTQFWIFARYFEALLLFTALLFFFRYRVRADVLCVIFGLVVATGYVLIMNGYFPDAFIEGKGLTPFKIISEYIIVGILILALLLLYVNHHRLKSGIFPFLGLSILLTICAELAFTFYVSVYGLSNLVGHIFKIFSYWLIFYSIVRSCLTEPYKELEVAKNKFRNLVETTSDWIWEIDEYGTYIYVSPKVQDILGYKPEEIIGRTPFDLMPSKEAQKISSEFALIVESKQPFSGLINENLHKSGKVITLESSGVPILAEDGALLGFRGIDRDITKHRQLEEQFNQSQKMEAVGTLVGGIAHDFNNTLAGITGNLYLAKKSAAELPDVVARLSVVEELAYSSAVMINQLLTFSRKDNVQMHAIALPSFLRELIKLQEVVIPENINLKYCIQDSSMVIKGDVNLLQQALINLINNARDAVEGVSDPTITIRLDHSDVDEKFIQKHSPLKSIDVACISVSDNGQGIKQSNIKHLYEPFFTTKEVGKGTGLGLSMTYGAIQSHEGWIDVESKEGEGSTFLVYLPLIKPSDIDSAPYEEDHVAEGNGETILLVDDNATLLSTGKDVLESLNYSVLTAIDGEEAVNVYQSQQESIDFLILDVVMPKLGGVEALRLIRELNPDVKAIFTTGYDKLDSLSKECDVSLIPVVSKPFSIAEISQTIMKVLDS